MPNADGSLTAAEMQQRTAQGQPLTPRIQQGLAPQAQLQAGEASASKPVGPPSPQIDPGLVRVKPELVQMVILAEKITTQPFHITCGIRTVAEQQAAIAQGHSQTMHSMHLIQPDGYGWAVDAVPVIAGKLAWDWQGCYHVAWAMHQASSQLGYVDHIRWGGSWDRRLSDFSSLADIQNATAGYQQRHPGHAFLDGPHYEWVE